ncbi:hypothetical protein OQX61_12485 [Pedobacter sp. PLR]|uniref:DUF5018-related domain-containing protein n=1 Tax=Pedobacter sp. PLR TaxID=2994465 RepID=UPI0022467D24|nr:hypothetical protein [Pedobacter sp. PLR]MCX2452081.1 hypothetical protein [Pedobacter sp. PLR]
MKHKNIWYGLPLIALLIFSGCMKPRVALDDTMWGDNATLSSAVLFKYEEVKNQLGYDEVVTGYQNVGISTTSNVLDKEKATINIVAVKGTDLTKIGIRFSHFAKKIEPLNGAPAAGIIADFSKGPFVYRLYSADGTIRDWTITVTVAP